MIKERYIVRANTFNKKYDKTYYYGTKHAQSWEDAVRIAYEVLEDVKQKSAVYKRNSKIPNTIIEDHLNLDGLWQMLCENGEWVEVIISRKLNKEEWLMWINNKMPIKTLGIYKRHEYRLDVDYDKCYIKAVNELKSKK